MLQNRLYRGEIVHKNEAHKGEHAPIIDVDVWQTVQTTLAANRVERGPGNADNHVSLLAGLIYDAHGEPMTPSHAVKKGVRYRYYVSKSLLTGDKEATKRGQRIPAAQIEILVAGRIRTWLADPGAAECGSVLSARRRCSEEASGRGGEACRLVGGTRSGAAACDPAGPSYTSSSSF
jgi:hypothetical protein